MSKKMKMVFRVLMFWAYFLAFGFISFVYLRLFHMEEIGKCKLTTYNPQFIMSTTTTPMYIKEAPIKLGKQLFSTAARKVQEGDVSIQIYEHYLVESSSKNKIYMPLDFDLKFGHQANPPTIYFEKESNKVSFELKSGSELMQWR